MNGTPTQESGSSSPVPTRGFWALIVTQFQGAFSDNALKWLVISMIAGMNLPKEERRRRLVSIVGALFALPFIVFSMTGGFLADRFSKRAVTIGMKWFEILVMFIALAGLATNHIYVTLAGVFLMGVHSAIFGPSKYGLLPELLPEKKLSCGNGVIELGTFLAIIGGTVAGGWLCKAFAAERGWSGVILIALAVTGFASLPRHHQSSRRQSGERNFNPLTSSGNCGRQIRAHAPRPSAVAGGRAATPTFSRHVAAADPVSYRHLCEGCAAHFRSSPRHLFAGGHRHRYRVGQFCRGLFVRRQN